MSAHAWLRPHFEKEGDALRFDRYMELALFDVEHGYYARLDRIGRTGDFSTSATLSSLLAVGVATWFEQQPQCHLIELGPGTGELSLGIYRHLHRFSLRRFLCPASHLHLVERSPALRQSQQGRLAGCRRVSWHDSLEDALQVCGGDACIFSNEFVDAWPVRVFRRSEEDTWEELSLRWDEKELVEEWQFANPTSSSVFDFPWKPGQRVEVHDSYREWMARWCSVWRSGQLLTIDYGGAPSENYRRRPGGTLRAYQHHQRLTGAELYRFPGQRDLTTDVNMDDLQVWGEDRGFTTVCLQSQREFLLPHLKTSATEADQFLVHPDGAGTAFKVLVQQCPPK